MAPVDLEGFYAYLLWSREALWRALEGVSEEALERPLVRKRLRSVKALLLHTAVVEDAWLHEDILRAPMVLAGFPEVEAVLEREGEGLPLRALRAYQEAVGRATWAFLQGPVDEDRVVAPHDAPEERYSLGDLLWHAFLHEVRHLAQVVLLLRLLGVEPPALDLYFFLRKEAAKGGQGEVF
jgi:uncharacterized damage-inducible protein DinB